MAQSSGVDIISFIPQPADSWYLQFPDGQRLPIVGFGLVEVPDGENEYYVRPVTFIAYADHIEVAEEAIDKPWRIVTAKGVSS